MSFRRVTVLLGAIALFFALPACTDDDEPMSAGFMTHDVELAAPGAPLR